MTWYWWVHFAGSPIDYEPDPDKASELLSKIQADCITLGNYWVMAVSFSPAINPMC